MIRVTLDTNVYISAILFGGKAEVIRSFSKQGKIEVFVSEVILAEIGKVLRRKFYWQSWQIAQVLDDIRDFSTLVTPYETISCIKEDDADNRILECAVEGKAKYVVSGDKHLLSLREYRGIKIVTPATLLDMLGTG